MPKMLKKTTDKWWQKRDLQDKSFKNPFFKRKQSFLSKLSYKWAIIILVLIILMYGFYYLFFTPFFTIKEIKVHGVDIDVTSKIRDLISQQLREKRFLIFRQNNIYAFNEKQALNNIQSMLLYQNINLDIVDGDMLINIEEKQGVLKWSTNSGLYLLNEEGVALRELAEYFPIVENRDDGPDVYRVSLMIEADPKPLVYDYSDIKVEIGKTVIKPEIIKKILDLQELLKNYIDIPITSYEMDNIESSQIRLNTIEGWRVYMNLVDNDIMERDILRLMVLIRKKFTDSRVGIEYIDLRNGERVFYK